MKKKKSKKSLRKQGRYTGKELTLNGQRINGVICFSVKGKILNQRNR